DRKSTRLNSSHLVISYAVFCLKKKSRHVHRRGHPRARRRPHPIGVRIVRRPRDRARGLRVVHRRIIRARAVLHAPQRRLVVRQRVRPRQREHPRARVVAFFFLLSRRPPRSTLFPYTTLFR